MAVGNTIGRIVGQSPASTSPPTMANPIAQLFQGLQQLIPMWQQLQGLIQQLGGGGGGGGGAGGGASPTPAPSGSPSTTGAPATSPSPEGGDALRSTTDLQARLIALGQRVRVRGDAMEGPARADQRLTRELTNEMLRQAMIASGPRGSAVHQLTLDATEARIAGLAGQAPSPAQAAQAVGNAATMANGRGAGAPVMQMLQKVMGIFQQALSLLQGLQKRSNGAQIKK
ncbi:MAG: hypothetical protein U0326_28270 [Polyangiales bacterium]